jgi:hypothetical protein
MGGRCDDGYSMRELSKFEHSEDSSTRVGDVRQRIPEERKVLEADEYCIPRLSKLTLAEATKVCLLIQRVELPITKAEMKIMMIIARNTIVATTRTGLNI